MKTGRRQMCTLLTCAAFMFAVSLTGTGMTRATADVSSTHQPQTQAAPEETGQPSARESSNVRCWQYGRLMFEETHLRVRDDNRKNEALVFESTLTGKQRKLHLFDTGTATCLYEEI